MDIQILQHSAAHVLADAVQQFCINKFQQKPPRLGYGGTGDEFYYDFDFIAVGLVPLREEFLPEIEAKMREIIKANLPFKPEEKSKKEAEEFFKKKGEEYKLKLIKEIPGKTVMIYKHGNFTDLCRGPHIDSTGQIKAFKLTRISGAYWKGIEKKGRKKNVMLQRICGVAFGTKEELDKYLFLQEEAKRRDHRKIGKDFDLFSIQDQMGAGLVFWHPKGALIRNIIEDYWKKEHLKRGYQLVDTPHIGRIDLWKASGHLEFYKEYMYSPMEVDKQKYVIKPMNCPGHILIYKTKTHSWRDLPLRLAELGTVYRYERSGVLHGLMRVRGFTQDDAHIFCTERQLKDEILSVLDLTFEMLAKFGFKEYDIFISTMPIKHVGTEKGWKLATQALEAALKSKIGNKYSIDPGEGVFYGPKIDVKIKDALGRSWQCTTIQVDFNLPDRFKVDYIDETGKKKRPIMIHRAILGSLERFFGVLVEHYAGAMPLWLSPVQAAVLPVTNSVEDYAVKIKDELASAGIRVETDLRSETLNYKIRDAQLQKIPYMLIVGEKEKEEKIVSVRLRAGGDQGQMGLQEFIEKIIKEAALT